MKREPKALRNGPVQKAYFYSPEAVKKCVRCGSEKLCRYMRTANQTEGWICKKCRKSNRRKWAVLAV